MSCCQEALYQGVDSNKRTCCKACIESSEPINYGAMADLLTAEFIVTPLTILPCDVSTFTYPITVKRTEYLKSDGYTSDVKRYNQSQSIDCCRIRTQSIIELPLIMTYRDIYTAPDAVIAKTKSKNEKISSDMEISAQLRNQTEQMPIYNVNSPPLNGMKSNGCPLSNSGMNKMSGITYAGSSMNGMNGLNQSQPLNGTNQSIYSSSNDPCNLQNTQNILFSKTINTANRDQVIFNNEEGTKRALSVKGNAYLANPGKSCSEQINRNAEISQASLFASKPNPLKPDFNYPNLITPLPIDQLTYDSPEIYRNPNLYEYGKRPLVEGTFDAIKSIPGNQNTILVDPASTNLTASPRRWENTTHLASSPRKWLDPLNPNLCKDGDCASFRNGNFYTGTAIPGYTNNVTSCCPPLISDPPNNPSGFTVPENQIVAATVLTSDDNPVYPALSVKSVFDLESRKMIITYLLYREEGVTFEQCVTLSIEKIAPLVQNMRRNAVCLSNAQRINLLLGVGLTSEFQSPTPAEIDRAFVIWLYTYIGYIGGNYWKCCGQKWINVGQTDFEFAPYDDNLIYGINSFNVDYMIERRFQQYSKPVLELQYPLILPKWRRLCSMARSNWDILMYNGCYYAEDIIHRKQMKLTKLITDNLWQIKQTLQILYEAQHAADDRLSTLEVMFTKLICQLGITF